MNRRRPLRSYTLTPSTVFLALALLIGVIVLVSTLSHTEPREPDLPACRLGSVIDWSAKDKQMVVAVRDSEGYVTGYRTQACR